MTKAERKAVHDLLDELWPFCNGCGCCSSQNANELPEFKIVSKLSKWLEDDE